MARDEPTDVRRVIVTGASGFLGAAVLSELRRQGVAAVGVSRREQPGTVQVADYLQAPDGDVLIHLAEDSDRGRVASLGAEYGARMVATMSGLARKAYGRIVYASSATLYGDAGGAARTPRDAVVANDVYARVKLECERAALASGRAAVARLANLFGPGMSENNVISTVLSQVPGTGPLRVFDDKPIRDFLWIEDAACAMTQMALGHAVGVFNVGSGQGTSVRQIATTALQLAAQGERPIVATGAVGRHSELVLDISATREAFAFEPRTSLQAGLQRLIEARRAGSA